MQISQGIRQIFSGQNIATSNYVYTSGELGGTNDGWETCNDDHVALQFQCATLNTGTVYISLEGRYKSGYKSAEISSFTISSSQSIASLYNVPYVLNQYRVGAKVSDVTSSPNNLYVYLNTIEDK